MPFAPVSDPDFQLNVLVQGFPGKSVCHGGLGWSTIALVRRGDRIILVDTGTFNARHNLHAELARLGLTPRDVTDVLLTHAHYDHALNWVLFPNARVHIGRVEMEWAAAFEPGDHMIPELYIQKLKESPQLRLIDDGAEFLPGFRAVRCAGHTPGCLVFRLAGTARDVLFTGDAAKNRAELLCRRADMTMDAAVSTASIDRIRQLWQARAETLLVPGHDTPMVLEDGAPRYVGTREAGVRAWFGDSIDTTTLFDFGAVPS